MSESITPRMDWANPDQGSAIKLFKQQCELYFSILDNKHISDRSCLGSTQSQ